MTIPRRRSRPFREAKVTCIQPSRSGSIPQIAAAL